MKKVAVLIPCYNEEKTVQKVVEDYRRDVYKRQVISGFVSSGLLGTEKDGSMIRR